MSEKKPPVCGTSSSSKSINEILDDEGKGSFPASDAPSSGKITGANDCVDDIADNTEKKKGEDTGSHP
ncbi:hypothetical protein [Acetobacter sp.]|uniref:hypothetical protein n=1 Tax=Acetobacter sp. TaxID=440 RepID=UPI0025BA417E|nr:hypothetical protein [Acetobacter sp.]MCH4090411.1 hypothetical protein [Acetobacter sp.]MCI1299105.1 hypothetical protein [Acetobacter sp.]MCI1315652.1 hypothetical protein [Acetobacter sp.]